MAAIMRLTIYSFNSANGGDKRVHVVLSYNAKILARRRRIACRRFGGAPRIGGAVIAPDGD